MSEIIEAVDEQTEILINPKKVKNKRLKVDLINQI